MTNHVPCTVCGEQTIDTKREVHAACREKPEGVGPPVEVPSRRIDVTAAPEPRDAPKILVPEHEVTPDDLPRGPSMVAAKVTPPWEAVWLHSEAEELSDPKRGGEAHGVKFRHPDGRNGWAIWLRGKFVAAFVYPFPGAMVPEQLGARDLKTVFSKGEEG